MSLYSINPDFLALLSKDEFDDADMQRLNALSDNERNTIISIAGYIKNIEAEANAIDEAVKNMQARSKALRSKIEFFSYVIKTKMEVLHTDCIDDSPYYQVKLHKNKSRVDIYDEERIPEEYWKVKETKTVSKEKIADDIINLGLVIPGANLVQEKRVVIK